MRHLKSWLTIGLFALIPGTARAQDAAISVGSGPTDAQISARLNDIFAQLDGLDGVSASVTSGVVTLSGETSVAGAAEQAVSIAERTDGIIAVQDRIERALDVSDNLSPVASKMLEWVTDFVAALPLLIAALLTLIAITLLGRFVSNRQTWIRRFVKNAFLIDLMATLIRLAFFVLGIVLALNILGATALLGTVLGGAGIIGIALGFGIRDTVENYIASLLLSIRQPFRAQDHVVIDGQEGIVVRLNTRATILMTLDGNHLRIPNAHVFKATILNYSTNPERRFSFEVGVDPADDPVAAIQLGIETMNALSFVLSEPPAKGSIVDVGDSSIVIKYNAWIDQRETGFSPARSQAIRNVKDALEANGFSLPEPLYRVKLQNLPDAVLAAADLGARAPTPDSDTPRTPAHGFRPAAIAAQLNTDAETTIVARVAEERRESGHTDLLDEAAAQE